MHSDRPGRLATEEGENAPSNQGNGEQPVRAGDGAAAREGAGAASWLLSGLPRSARKRVNMRNLIKLTTLAAVSALALSAPAFAGKSDNSVVMAYDQAPESVDPFFNNVRIGVIIGQHVWDTLIYRDPITNDYKGQLAKSWKWVDDRTLEVELREGIKFHNGEEFDADDVVYTLNFVSKPENKVTTQQNVSWIEKAEKLDKYKLRITTKKVFPA